MTTALVNPPSFVEHKHLRFLIIDAPNDMNLHTYIREFKKYGVTDVVRACEASYATDPLVSAGIEVHDMAFADGDPPPEAVLTRWLDLADARFGKKAKKPKGGAGESKEGEPKPTIAVHCVAGLGRAPVLVGVALIEEGLEPLKAVTFIREKRRGAINARQLRFLEAYQRRRKGGRCTIM